jgi:hypothetical protein
VPLLARRPLFPDRTLGNFRSSGSLFDWAALLLPFGLAVEFQFSGRLFMNEFIALALSPVMLPDIGSIFRDRVVRGLSITALLWLLFQVATDLARHSPYEDYSRGWSRVVFLMLNFYTIVWIVAYQEKRIKLMMVGVSISFVLIYFFRRPPFDGLFDWWKLFWVLPVSLLIGLAASWVRRPFGQIGIMLGAVALNWSLNGRSMGGICLIVVSLLLVRRQYLRRIMSGREFSHRLHFFIPIALVLLTLVVFPSFSALAMKGYFGQLERDRTVTQVQSGQQYIGRGLLGQFFGLLIGGRNEIIVSSRAIMDSPFLGHGSWAKDVTYLDLYAELGGQNLANYREAAAMLFDNAVIPTHSHFFGAWVDGGIGGAVFWGYAFWLFYEALICAVISRSRLAPLYLLVIVLELWDILFSPFGAERRFTEALFMVCLCVLLNERRLPLPLRLERRH